MTSEHRSSAVAALRDWCADLIYREVQAAGGNPEDARMAFRNGATYAKSVSIGLGKDTRLLVYYKALEQQKGSSVVDNSS